MPLPVWIALTYLVTNLVLAVSIVRAETGGQEISDMVSVGSAILRYGPPLLGLGYLVTKAGDWPFVLFVAAFFALAAWLLHGLLNYPTQPPRP